MIAIISALLAAMSFGLTVVLIKKRLDESNFIFVSLATTIIGIIILWPIALVFTDLRTVKIDGVLLFALAGGIAAISNLLYFKGMELVEVSVNAAVYAIYPMYTSILAVLLLREVLTLENWIGVFFIVIGVWFIERSLHESKTGTKRVSKRGLALPFLSSLAISFSQIIRKQGLNIYNEPLLGVAISYVASLVWYPLLIVSYHARLGFVFSVRDFRLFWKAGVLNSLGLLLAFYAFSHERASIAAPLLQTEALFVLFFGYIYLRELEPMSSKLALAALLIVMGAMLVSFF